MSSIAAIMQTFFAESLSLLEQMEGDLLRLESDPTDATVIDAVFRAAHTIKGSAGLFAFEHIVAFTHHAEELLEQARAGHITVDADMIGLLLQCRDHLGYLLDAAITETEPDAATLDESRRLGECLRGLLDQDAAATVPATQEPTTPIRTVPADDDTWHISVRFGVDLFRTGTNLAALLRYLATLGQIVHVVTVDDALPNAATMDPESCYLGLEIRLRSTESKAVIEKAFEFVRDDCLLSILPPGSKVEDYLRLIDDLPEDRTRLGDLLVACGAVTEHELQALLALQQQQRDGSACARLIGELTVQQHVAPPKVVQAALSKQREARLRQTSEAQLIRVQAGKLDGLIDRVGELVIASAGIGQTAARIGESDLLEAVSGMARLVEDIREDAMRLRMVEIGETFNRFRRVVRDVSRQLGKDIDLLIEGADTELDKNLVEQIADPLTHLIRNAIDHGIESTEQRLLCGKPARGVIRLAAHHEAGNVVIEIGDDGGGLDREAILTKARQRGMIDDGVQLADADVWGLIFAPGFSTAAQVNDLSGRGVGMDVVKRSIEGMRGTIEIDAVAGRGTTFRIRQPLTLAIIDGFLMGVSGNHYVAPLDAVVECVELGHSEHERGYLNLRGEVLPLLRLREHFDLDGDSGRRQNVVVVNNFGLKAGLVVDQLEGELQAVIKPLGRLFSRLVGISGTTVLGSGEIALVLDIPSLLASVAKSGRDAVTPH